MSRHFKRGFLISVHIFIIILAQAVSCIFFDPLVSIPQRTFLIHILFVIIAYVAFGQLIKIFDKINRFTSIRETFIHAILVTSSFLVGSILFNILAEGISFRHVALSYLITVILIPSSRVVWRLYM